MAAAVCLFVQALVVPMVTAEGTQYGQCMVIMFGCATSNLASEVAKALCTNDSIQMWTDDMFKTGSLTLAPMLNVISATARYGPNFAGVRRVRLKKQQTFLLT
jgi:hypothetical protein